MFHRISVVLSSVLLMIGGTSVQTHAFKIDYWTGGTPLLDVLKIAQKHNLSISPDCIHAYYGYDHKRATFEWGKHLKYCYFDKLMTSNAWVQLDLKTDSSIKRVTYKWVLEDPFKANTITRQIKNIVEARYGPSLSCNKVGFQISIFDTINKCWKEEASQTRIRITQENANEVDVIFDALPKGL